MGEVERVMKPGGRAIITTPNVDTDTYISSGKDSHSSLWKASDFKSYGYSVHGVGVRLAPGIGRWYTPYVLAFGFFVTPLSYYIPWLGGFLIAVKDF